MARRRDRRLRRARRVAARAPRLRRRRPGTGAGGFWDYEIDRAILDDEGWAGLADRGFDPPRRFAAFFHTLRWHCTTATDPNLFQAPFRAGITIDAYQMELLRKALRLPRVNLFIADDTGLGKTIEAGLIARELLLRRKARVIVAAVPPSVLEQWRPPAPRDGSTITLRYPVTHEGETISSLTMRRPRLRDLLAADRLRGTDAAKEVRIFANLCEVAPDALDEMDLADYAALQSAYRRFTAVSAEHARQAILLLAAQTGWALGDIEDFSVEELTKWLESLRRVQPRHP